MALLGTPLVQGAAFLTCDRNSIIEYFSCQSPVPEACAAGVADQVTAFCNSYLSIEPVTVYTTATAVVITETVSETAETDATATELTTTTTTAISTSFGLEAKWTTLTATVTAEVSTTQVTVVPRAEASSCVDLTKKNLTKKHPAAKLSSACSCLDVEPTTVFLGSSAPASTETATETVFVTKVVSKTSVVTEVSKSVVETTQTSVFTATVTETANPQIDICSVSYRAMGNGQGNTVQFYPATGQLDCCRRCQEKTNCLAGAYSAGSCQLLVKLIRLPGAQTTDQCPLGVEDYNFGAPVATGNVFAGPCAL
ncbi:hypothetical protein B0H63DRAFT_446007 [Podospora didyma]|uniref:Uncharacterized protein n=1 Tax=Podospora didyma TaxID=330526 RepID=A0AAE0NY18_9PEZI|nr:hypothetical protein B0H63DRAFT_446007 [Podospora didyma]